jgi:hypothetical protein
VLVSLTDWLDDSRRAALESTVGIPVECESLLAGTFTFSEDERFDPGSIPQVTGNGVKKDGWLRRDHGRLGLRGRSGLDVDVEELIRTLGLERGMRVLVLGTGEFLHLPFRLALEIEGRGFETMFQSTTRSPLLVGHDLASVLETVDNYHDGIPNYLYNVVDRSYDRILIGYETSPVPAEHRLAEQLGGQAIHL